MTFEPFELMKKVMMTGIGFALKTQSEIEELTSEIINKSKMGEEEGRKFVDEMMNKYDEARKDMEQKIRDGIAEYMAHADIARKKDLDALKKDVEALKKAASKKSK